MTKVFNALLEIASDFSQSLHVLPHRRQVFRPALLQHDLAALLADRPHDRPIREERMRSFPIADDAVRNAAAEQVSRLERSGEIVSAVDPRHQRNLPRKCYVRQSLFGWLLVTLVGFAALSGTAAAATWRWSVPQANKALRSFKFARPGAVNTVNCHGKGRATQTRFTAFRCTVFGQIPAHGAEIAANVEIQVVGQARYRITSCQTASMPLGQKVCP